MNPDIVIPLAGIALPAFLVPTILTFRQAAKKREHLHLERMRALEMGQPVPGESSWPQAFVCAMVGAGVPLGSFLFTWLASVTTMPRLSGEVWFAPTVVSLGALAFASQLAGTLFRPSRATASTAHLNGKPAMDPDAYDVVGSRG